MLHEKVVSDTHLWGSGVWGVHTSPAGSATAGHGDILLLDAHEPKVSHLHVPVLIHQQVQQLQVAVHNHLRHGVLVLQAKQKAWGEVETQ